MKYLKRIARYAATVALTFLVVESVGLAIASLLLAVLFGPSGSMSLFEHMMMLAGFGLAITAPPTGIYAAAIPFIVARTGAAGFKPYVSSALLTIAIYSIVHVIAPMISPHFDLSQILRDLHLLVCALVAGWVGVLVAVRLRPIAHFANSADRTVEHVR